LQFVWKIGYVIGQGNVRARIRSYELISGDCCCQNNGSIRGLI